MANKQYLIELAVQDDKLRSSLKKALTSKDVQKTLGILGEGITDHLEHDVDKAKSILGKVDWASLLGQKDFERLQQLVAKTVSANKDLIKSFIKTNDVQGMRDVIELVSALGDELKEINPGHTVDGLARSMASFMKVLAPLTGQLDTLTGAPDKIAAAFSSMASSVDKSMTSVYNRAGKTLEKMNNDVLKHLKTQLDEQGVSIIKYQIDDVELKEYINQFKDAKAVAEALNKEIENSQSALRRLGSADTRDASTMMSLVKYEQKITALRTKLATLQPSINGDVVSKEIDVTIEQVIDKLEKSFNKIIEDKLSSIKVKVDVPTEDKLIEDLNAVIDKVNRKGTSTLKLMGAESAIKEAQNKILANTQKWHEDMKKALKFNKKEDIELDLGVKLREIGSDVGADLRRSIEEYFDNPANKVSVPVELVLTGENKAVIEGGGGNIIVNGGGGEVTAESLMKALTTPIEVKVQEEQSQDKPSSKSISLDYESDFAKEVLDVFDKLFTAIERGGENAKKISEFFAMRDINLPSLKNKPLDILRAYESFLERGDKSILDYVENNLAKGGTKNVATTAFRDLLRESVFRFDLEQMSTKEDMKRRAVRDLVVEKYIPQAATRDRLSAIMSTKNDGYQLPTVEELGQLIEDLPKNFNEVGAKFLPAIEALKALRGEIADPKNAADIKRFKDLVNDFIKDGGLPFDEIHKNYMKNYKIGVFYKGRNKHKTEYDRLFGGGIGSGKKISDALDKIDYFEIYDDPSGHFSRGNRQDALDNASSLDRYQLRRDSREAFYRSKEPTKTSPLATKVEVSRFEPKIRPDERLQEINAAKNAAEARAQAMKDVQKASAEEAKAADALRKQELETDKKRRTALKSQRTKNANKLTAAESAGLGDEAAALKAKNAQIEQELAELDARISKNSVEPTKQPTVLQQLKELPTANEVQSIINDFDDIDIQIDKARQRAAELDEFVKNSFKEVKYNVDYTKNEKNHLAKSEAKKTRRDTLTQILNEKDRTRFASLTGLDAKDKKVAAKLLNDRKIYKAISGLGGLEGVSGTLIEDAAQSKINKYNHGLNRIDEFLLKYKDQTIKTVQDDGDLSKFMKDANARSVLAGTFKGSKEKESEVTENINQFKAKMVEAGKSYIVDYLDMWSDKALRELMMKEEDDSIVEDKIKQWKQQMDADGKSYTELDINKKKKQFKSQGGIANRRSADAQAESILQEFYHRVVEVGAPNRSVAFKWLKGESAKYQKKIQKDEGALEKIVVDAWDQTDAMDSKNQSADNRVKTQYKEYVSQWLHTMQQNMYEILFDELDDKGVALRSKKNDELRELIESFSGKYSKQFGENLLTDEDRRLLGDSRSEYASLLRKDVSSLIDEKEAKQDNLYAIVQEKATLLKQRRFDLLNKIASNTNNGKNTASLEKALTEVEDELIAYSGDLPDVTREIFEADLLHAKNATEEEWQQFAAKMSQTRKDEAMARKSKNDERLKSVVGVSTMRNITLALPSDASLELIEAYNKEVERLIALDEKRSQLKDRGQRTDDVDKEIGKQIGYITRGMRARVDEERRVATSYDPKVQAAQFIRDTDSDLYILQEQEKEAKRKLDAANANLEKMLSDEYKNTRIYRRRIETLKSSDVSEYVRSDEYKSARRRGEAQADKEFSEYLTEKLGEDVAKRIVYEFTTNSDRANVDNIISGEDGNTMRLADTSFSDVMADVREDYMASEEYRAELAKAKEAREKTISELLKDDKDKTDAKVQEIWNKTKEDIQKLRSADLASSDELRAAVNEEAQKVGMGDSSEYRRSIVEQVREGLIQKRIDEGRKEQKFYNSQYYEKAHNIRSELSPAMYDRLNEMADNVAQTAVMVKLRELIGDNEELIGGLAGKRKELMNQHVGGIVDRYRDGLRFEETNMYQGQNIREQMIAELRHVSDYYMQKYVESSGKTGLLRHERGRAQSFGELGYDETLNPEIAHVQAETEARLSEEKAKQVSLTERLTELTAKNADYNVVHAVAAELQATEKMIDRLQLRSSDAANALDLRKIAREEELENNKYTPEKIRLWLIDHIESAKSVLESGTDEQKAKASSNIAKWEQKLVDIEKVIEDSKPEVEKPKTVLDMITAAIREGLAGVTAGGTVDLDASLYNIATETTLQEILRLLGGNGAVEYANALKAELSKDRPYRERTYSDGGVNKYGKKNKGGNNDLDRLNSEGQRIYSELDAQAKIFISGLKNGSRKYATDFDFVKAIKDQVKVVQSKTKGELEYMQEQTKLTLLYQDYYKKTFGAGKKKKGQPGQSAWAEQGELGKIDGLKDLLLFKYQRADALIGLNYGVEGAEVASSKKKTKSSNKKKKSTKTESATTTATVADDNGVTQEQLIANITVKVLEDRGIKINAKDAAELNEMVAAAIASANSGVAIDEENPVSSKKKTKQSKKKSGAKQAESIENTPSEQEQLIANATARALEASGAVVDSDDAAELAEMVKAAIAEQLGDDGLGRDKAAKHKKAYPEYSDAISVGYDRIQKLQKIREGGVVGPRSTEDLLRVGRAVWDQVKANNFFSDIPEDNLQKSSKIVEVINSTVNEILQSIGMTETQLVEQLNNVKNATGGRFKNFDSGLGWTRFATYNDNGNQDRIRKSNGLTYKVYASFENIQDLNADIVSSIMKELSDAGFKGQLKTTTGSTGASDKLNAIVNTDQLVAHGSSKKDQEIAYNVLKKMGLNLSYLSGGIDTPDGSFTQTLASNSIGKYVAVQQKEAKVEPEIIKGAVAEEVKENVKQTPPIVEVKPEIKSGEVEKEVKKKTKSTRSSANKNTNAANATADIYDDSVQDHSIPYTVSDDSIIGKLRNTVGGDTGALAKQATLALVLAELQKISSKIPTIGKAGVKSSAQSLLEEFQKMAEGSSMDSKERVSYLDLVNGAMSPALSGTTHSISQALLNSLSDQYGPDKGYKSQVHTHADSEQTWFSEKDLNHFKKNLGDFGVDSVKQQVLLTKDNITVFDMTMVETAEKAAQAIDILKNAGANIDNGVLEKLAGLGARYQSMNLGSISAKGLMDLLGVQNYKNDGKKNGAIANPKAALAGLESFAKLDADKRNSKYVFNSFDGETLKYQLVDVEGHISKVVLAWDELEKKVRVVSDTSTSSLDSTVSKIQQYHDEIKRAQSEKLLSEGDDASFVAADKAVDDIIKKIESGDLSGAALSAAINELETARNKLAEEGAKLHKLISRNNKLRGGTTEVKSAITQGVSVRSMLGDAIETDERDGVQVFDVADGSPKYLQDYVLAYNDLVQVQQQYIKDGRINNPKIQDALKVQAASVKKLGIEAMDAYQNTLKLQEQSDIWSAQTYVDKSGAEHALGGSIYVGGNGADREVMLQYAKDVLGADLASVKLNATTGKLTGVLRKNNYVVSDMAVEYDKATGKLHLYQEKERDSLSGVPSFLRGLKERTSALVQYVASMTSIYRVIGAIKQGIQYVREIDLALTELKKVTNETSETYDKFLQTAAKTGARLGSTIAEVTQATATFAKLGYSMEQSSVMAEAAIVYKNVGDNIASAEDAASSIISTMKGFGLETSESMAIVDRFNEVGNKFAITSQGIGEALRLSASALHEGGNSLDESIALITAANEVVNDPSSVGTALKTLTLRLRGAKTELEEMGEDVSGMATTTSQLQSKLLALTGGKVDIMLDANTFKSSTQILREMADAWEHMTDIQRASALELMGGKRQANVLSALIQNFDTVESVIETSENSAGSALRENERYLDSIQGKIDQFKNAVQSMWSNALDSDLIKGIVDLGTKLVKVIDKIGLLNTALVGLASYSMIKHKMGPFAFFKGLIESSTQGINKLTDYAKGLKNISFETSNLANAKTTLTQKDLKEKLVRTGLTDAAAEEIVTKTKLGKATDELSATTLDATLREAGYSKKKREAIAQSVFDTAETKANTAANIENAESNKVASAAEDLHTKKKKENVNATTLDNEATTKDTQRKKAKAKVKGTGNGNTSITGVDSDNASIKQNTEDTEKNTIYKNKNSAANEKNRQSTKRSGDAKDDESLDLKENSIKTQENTNEKIENTNANNQNANSNQRVGMSLKNVGKSLGSFVKNNLSTFIMLGTTIAITGLTHIMNAIVYTMEEARDAFSEAASELDSMNAELQNLESQLKDINSQIEEIQSQGTLSFTDQEELSRLKAQGDELQRQIDLATTLQQQQAIDVNNKAMIAADKYQNVGVNSGKTTGERVGNTVKTVGGAGLAATGMAASAAATAAAVGVTNAWNPVGWVALIAAAVTAIAAGVSYAVAESEEKVGESLENMKENYTRLQNEFNEARDAYNADPDSNKKKKNFEEAQEALQNYQASMASYMSETDSYYQQIRANWDVATEEQKQAAIAWSDQQDAWAIQSGGVNASYNALNRIFGTDASQEIEDIKKSLQDAAKQTGEVNLYDAFDGDDEAYNAFKQRLYDIGLTVAETEQYFEKEQRAAEDAISTIETYDAVKNIKQLTDGVRSLQNAFKELYDYGSISADTLLGLEGTFGDVDGWQEFFDTVSSGTATIEEAQKQAQNLAENYVDKMLGEEKLDGKSYVTVLSHLQQLNVTNATEFLDNKIKKDAINKILRGGLTPQEVDELEQLINSRTSLTDEQQTRLTELKEKRFNFNPDDIITDLETEYGIKMDAEEDRLLIEKAITAEKLKQEAIDKAMSQTAYDAAEVEYEKATGINQGILETFLKLKDDDLAANYANYDITRELKYNGKSYGFVYKYNDKSYNQYNLDLLRRDMIIDLSAKIVDVPELPVKVTSVDVENANDAAQNAADAYQQEFDKYGLTLETNLVGFDYSVDKIQDAYSTLKNISSEYNKQGYLSLDNLQAFLNLSPAYLAVLQMENGQITINQQALEGMLKTKFAEAEATAVQTAITQLSALAERKQAIEISNSGVAASQAQVQLGTYSNALNNVATDAIVAAGSVQAFNAALQGAQGNSFVGDSEIQQILDNFNKSVGLINSVKANLSEYFNDVVDPGSQTADETVTSDKFQKAMDYWENRIGAEQSRFEQVQNEIDLLEKQGKIAGEDYYQEQIDSEERRLDLLQQQKAEAEKYLGQFKEGSDEWWDAANTLNDIENEIDDVTASIQDLSDAMAEVDWTVFTETHKRYGDIHDDLDTMRDLLSPNEEEDWFDDEGMWTDNGTAYLATYISDLQYYEGELEDVTKKLNKDYSLPYAGNEETYKELGIDSEQELYDKRRELLDQQSDIRKSMSDTQQSVADMYESQIDAVEEWTSEAIESYQDYIDVVNEALDAERDLHDFKKSIEEDTKNIASLERRIASMSGSTDASDIAEMRKLQAELNDAKSDLDDKFYDHAKDAQSQALDDEADAYEKSMNKFIEGLRTSLETAREDMNLFMLSVISAVTSNAPAIVEQYKGLGIALNSAIINPWTEAAEAIEDFGGADGLGIMNKWIAEGGELPTFKSDATTALTEPWAEGGKAIEEFEELVRLEMSEVVQTITTNVESGVKALQKLYAEQAKIKTTDVTSTPKAGGIGGTTALDYTPQPTDPTPQMVYKGTTSPTDKIVKDQTGAIEGFVWQNGSKKKAKYYRVEGRGNAYVKEGSFGESGSIYEGTYYYVPKYAKGTMETKRDEWAITNEPWLGDELTMYATPQGTLSFMRAGSTVIPADLTRELIDMAEFGVEGLTSMPKFDSGINLMSNAINKPEIKLDIENFLRCDNVSQDALPELKRFVNEQMNALVRQLNYGLKKSGAR